MKKEPVALADIVEALEIQSEDSRVFFDRETGEILYLGVEELSAAEEGTDPEEFPGWQRELVESARAVCADADRYLAHPDRFEVHKYQFLQRFAWSYPNRAIAQELSEAIRGRGAFGRFRAAVRRLGIEAEWDEYRARCFLGVAREWCEAEGIQYRD